MLLMHACARLKWRVICGVHDGKPVLAEGGAVRPSEVSHKLGGGERERKKRK